MTGLIAFAPFGTTQAAVTQWGGNPNPGGNVTVNRPYPETAAERTLIQQKMSREALWLRANHLPSSASIITIGTSRIQPNTLPICLTISPKCGGGGGNGYPYGGAGSASTSNTNLSSGAYIQEPSSSSTAYFNQPNWCGAGSSTSVLLHWGWNTVTNASNASLVPVDFNDNGLYDQHYGTSAQGYVNYSGAWGYMGWLATNVFGNGTGVVTYSFSNGKETTTPYTNIYTQASGLNQALNNMGYGSYYAAKNYSSSQESTWQSDAQYDIGYDHRPMIFRGNAAQFGWWNPIYLQGQNPLNHVIMGYGYDATGFNIADTASLQDGAGIAGNWHTTYSQLWLAATTAQYGAYVDY